MFSRAAIIAVGALFVQTAFGATCSRSYTVASGDTCDAISAANNASTYQLAVLNPTVDDACDNLEIGQNLCLGTAGSDCTDIHVVVSGDSCSGVVATFGINSTLLWANNPQLDAECSNLYIGEVVCVDAKYNVPSLPAGQKAPSKAVPAGVEKAAPAATSSSAAATSSSAAPSSTPIPYEDLPWCEEGDDGW